MAIRLFVNFSYFIQISSNTKWNYKTQKFEVSNGRLIIYKLLLANQSLLTLLNLGYVVICMKFDLGKSEFVVAIACFILQAIFAIFHVQRVQNPAFTMTILNETQQLNLKFGKY